MRIARRTVLASGLAAIAAPAVLRLARADAPTVLKLHHFMSSVASGHDKFLVPWARKIEAESGGRLRIDLFPSMQLGGTTAGLFDQARDGTVDIAWASPALTPGRFPKIEMFELPFVPSRRALVSTKALEDFAAANLKDEFREVHPLSFSCTDRAVLHATIPIRTIEDLKDLKLHVETRFAGEAVRALGAQPVPMPSGQLPTAIAAHVIDGCLDPWHAVPPLRLNDMLKIHTEFSDTSLSSTTFVLVMNQGAYDRLPRELKTVIDNNSGQAAANLAGAMWDLQAATVADMVAQRGDTIVTLLPEAVTRWRKATEPVTAIWLKEMKEQKTDGAKLLAQARALLAKYSSLPEPQPSQTPQPADQQPQASADPPRPDAKPDLTTRPRGSVSTAPPPSPASSPAPAAPSPAPAPAVKPAATTAAKPAPSLSTSPATSSAPAATPQPTPPASAPVKPIASPTPAPAPVKPITAPPAASPAPATTPVAPTPPPPSPAPAVAATPPAPAPVPPPSPPIPVKPVAPVLKPPPKALDIPL